MISIIDDLEISPYVDEPSQYLIEVKLKEKKTIVNKETIRLIDTLKELGPCENEVLFNKFNQNKKKLILRTEFESAIKMLSELGIIYNEEISFKKKTHKYLKIKISLLSRKLVNKLSIFFLPLFNSYVFYSLCALPFVIYYLIINITDIFEVFLSQPLFYFPSILIAYTSVVFHEIGHATALKKNKLSPGEIGFGLYLFIMPVFYTNLDEIWKLPSKKRFLVNIGGVYFQYLFSLLFFVLGLFKPIYMVAVILILSSALYQFNPIIRLDGYWIASDYFKQTDVIKSANQKLITLLVDILKNKSINYSRKDYFFILFGLISGSYIFFLFGFILLSLWDPYIINFSLKFIEIKNSFNREILFDFDFLNEALPLLMVPGLFLGIIFFSYRFIIFLKKVTNEYNQD